MADNTVDTRKKKKIERWLNKNGIPPTDAMGNPTVSFSSILGIVNDCEYYVSFLLYQIEILHEHISTNYNLDMEERFGSDYSFDLEDTIQHYKTAWEELGEEFNATSYAYHSLCHSEGICPNDAYHGINN